FWKADSEGHLLFWKRQDSSSRLIEFANLTEDGRPYVGQEGHHRWTARYDSRGNMIEGAFFGLDGKPIVLTAGYHGWRAIYDEKGRMREQVSFGVKGEPAFSSEDGSYRTLWRYDTQGERTEVLHLGPNGRLQNTRRGYARTVIVYRNG